MTSAILYAAKSTEDRRGGIPTQLADCRAAAEAEGRDVVAQYSDESASARTGKPRRVREGRQ
jgi:Resolvase, N terminal domain